MSGTGAKYFTIGQNANDANDATDGLISTKKSLDHEAKDLTLQTTGPREGLKYYDVTVTATDPFLEPNYKLEDPTRPAVTVRIYVLDRPEIKGTELRLRVPENTFKIADLSVADPPDDSLGGIKWSLLTTTAEAGDEDQTTPPHNRNHADSIDCHYDATNDGLCDNFKFSNFNTAETDLEFAIGTGKEHAAPDFENPADRSGTRSGDAGTATALDNVYEIRVRAAFANLRSEQPGDTHEAADPHPRDDEKQDRTIWIRVDDVDEAPRFTTPPTSGRYLKTPTTSCPLSR